MVEVVKLNVNLHSQIKSFFFAVIWFVGSFLMNTVGGMFFYNITLSSYVVLITFAGLQFFLGCAFAFLLQKINQKAFFEIFSWMLVLVIIERVFFRSYVFFVVDLMSITSVSSDILAGFFGFFFVVYLNNWIKKTKA